MKNCRKLVTLLLAVVMAMVLAVPAFAVGTTGSLIVERNENNSLKGQTIKIYKLFDLTTDKKNYAYQVNPAFKAEMETVLGTGVVDSEVLYTKVSQLGQSSSPTIQEFANMFTAEMLKGNKTETRTSGKISTDETQYTFDNLEHGYYLVYQTGTLTLQASLVTVDDHGVEVLLKGEKPSIDKVANKDTAEIGEVITYTITGKIPDTTGYTQYTYKINDTLSAGLDFVKNENGEALESSVAVPVTVKMTKNGTTEGMTAVLTEKKMVLDLSAWVRNHQDAKGEEFTVTYYAKVNQSAVITQNNQASLEYGNEPNATVETVPVEAKTHTYPLQIKKTDKSTGDLLAGATFRLYRTEKDAKNNTNAIPVKMVTEGKYVFDAASTGMDMVSVKNELGSNVNLEVNGLKEGTYYLVETQAPVGYNKITAPIKITIQKSTTGNPEDWTLSKDDVVEVGKIINVKNSTGTILPGTGGMGTVIFTVVGITMIVGIAISFVYSRKKSN